MSLAIPIVFGVTGHRDLREKDISKLKQIVRDIFKKQKQTLPNTPIVVMSGLAEGADMLVAEVALQEGASLIAVLPYNKEEYLKSFEDTNEIKRFEELYSKAKYKITLQEQKEGGYVALAKFLANNTNILLALWDGVDNGKKGGTADVVKQKQQWYVENRLDVNEEDMIIHIKTPRKANPNVENPFSIKYIFIGRTKKENYQDIIKHIDNTNRFLDIKEDLNTSIVDQFRSFFAKRAKKFKRKYLNSSILMLFLAFLAVVSVEVAHNFASNHAKDHKPLVDLILHNIDYLSVAVYLLTIFLIFVIYFSIIKESNLNNHFVHSRGLAEALRVQSYWFYLDKKPKRAGDYYLMDEIGEFVWIRAVLRNIYLLEILNPKKSVDINYVIEDWIVGKRGQINYYKSKLKEKKKLLETFEIIEKIFYFIAVAATLVLFYLFLFKSSINHLAFFISGTSFAAAAFIGEKLIPILGYKEEIKEYELMLYNFQKAKDLLDKTESENEKKEILYDLGKKALKENSKWLVYHSKYKIKPIVE